MDDLLAEFLTETAESLDVLDVELVRFETDPTDRATLNNIFRLVHTIKGTCGFLGLPRLEGVAHAGETLLGKFRDGDLVADPDAVSVVLRAIDRIKVILVGLEATGSEPAGDDSALIADLVAVSEGRGAAAAPPPKAEAPVGPNGEQWDPQLERFLRPGEVSLADLEAAFMSVEAEIAPSTDIEEAHEPIEAVDEAPPTPAYEPAARAQALSDHDDDDAPRASRGGDAASQTIRVNVDVLEQLMTMVSELVLTRNQLLQMVRQLNDSEFKAPLQRLSHVTAELQDRVMKTRMQPVGAAWRKLPRIVRDICRETGKKIELLMEGESTELDRQVLELIRDPLTHMVRNSADHGIEAPGARIAAGKSEMGVIRLSAHHEGGHIIILVADDGKGLDTERIRRKAVDKGLVSAAEAATLTEAQVHRFIFAPGFSTATAVTNLSGRGVGMDVVKTNVEQIGGSIEMTSQEGRGSTFRIKIPLTLAIISALIIGAGGQRFAAPQTAVLELVAVGGADGAPIETIHRTPVLRLRDKLLPLLALDETLGLTTAVSAEDCRYVVVMQVGAARFGVIVDEVHDTEEIVVKPLAKLLRGASMLSGATILGDGSVVVILDPNGLVDALGAAHGQSEEDQAVAAVGGSVEGRDSLVLFRAGDAGYKAAPLMLVTRLEDVMADQIERPDGRPVLQYRGALMPIVHPGGDHFVRTDGRQPILVFAGGARPFGLAVDEIVDIVHEKLEMQLVADRPGVLGAGVVRGRATEIIDVGHYLSMAIEAWADRGGSARRMRGRVLLVESSDFTRNLLTPLLAAAGYEAWTADSADEALVLCEAEGGFDAVLADIDADPDGAAALATAIAADPMLGESPVYALSERRRDTHAFAGCVQKTDRAQLLATLEDALRRKEVA